MVSTHKRIDAVKVWLVEHGWLPGFGDRMLVVATQDEKGVVYKDTVRYIQDGPHFVAFDSGVHSSWFDNILHEPEVMLTIDGQRIAAYGAEVSEEAERRRLWMLWESEQPAFFSESFGVFADGSVETYRLMSFTRLVP